MKESVSIELFRVTACKWIFTYWFYHFTRLIISARFYIRVIVVFFFVLLLLLLHSVALYVVRFFSVRLHTQRERLHQMKLLAVFSNDLVKPKTHSEKMMEQTFKTAKIFFGNRHIDNLDSKISRCFLDESECGVYVKRDRVFGRFRQEPINVRFGIHKITSILSQTIVEPSFKS